MESNDLQQQLTPDRLPSEAVSHQAPATLLSSVVARLERLDDVLAPDRSLSSRVESTHDARWEVRAAALQSLSQEGESTPLEPITAALRDEHVMVRVAAVRSLGRLGRHAPLDQLVLAQRDPDWEVREAVALTLGELEMEAARPLLLVAQQDAHAAVRLAAQQGLAAHTVVDRAGSGVRHQMVAPAAERLHTRLHTIWSTVAHYWHILVRQPAILQRNWWLPALLLFLSDGLVLFTTLHFLRSLQDTVTTLSVVTTLSAALGVAFAANLAHDAGMEIALSTATSLRVILLCRFLVVTGSAVLLSGCASVVIALVYGQGLWGVIQLWLGPMLLASALTLALVLMIGSWLAVFGACVLEALQTLRVGVGAGGQLLPLEHPHLWQTTPLILLLSAACLLVAFLYAPRQALLRRSGGW